ncbi:LPD38 domain-containing protein [Paraferrimonas sedimenticola]|uniref:Large polyvalent protein-associated domain-containing protein n=1 Tax=Paraferrimonas sedimenticola TaxID=375674 RepID=A0AA37VTB0_9GAMM|nr:LPD38 domain-containing protein [Paraferrimonas sedimenticola]GLP95274.1 hypothetical protein GCM10007895_05800 [Paraferrimonas sedimenticola]
MAYIKFDPSQYAPKGNPVATNEQGRVGDFIDAFQAGAQTGLGGVFDFVGANAVAESFYKWAQDNHAEMSQSGQEALSKTLVNWNDDGSVSLGEGLTDFDTWLLNFAQLGGQLASTAIPGAGAAGLLAKTAKLGGKLKKANNVAGYALPGGASGTGLQMAEARQEVLELPDQILAESKRFGELVAKQHADSPELSAKEKWDAAKSELAEQVADEVRADPKVLLANFAASAIGDPILGKALLGMRIAKNGVMKSAATGFITEGTTEAAQAGISKYGVNQALQPFDGRELDAGVANAAVNEGILGGAFGGTVGGIGGIANRNPQPNETKNPAADKIRQDNEPLAASMDANTEQEAKRQADVESAQATARNFDDYEQPAAARKAGFDTATGAGQFGDDLLDQDSQRADKRKPMPYEQEGEFIPAGENLQAGGAGLLASPYIDSEASIVPEPQQPAALPQREQPKAIPDKGVVFAQDKFKAEREALAQAQKDERQARKKAKRKLNMMVRKRQMELADAPKQLVDKGIIFLGNAQGKPFASAKAAKAAKPFKDAQKDNLSPTVQPVEGGHAIAIKPVTEAGRDKVYTPSNQLIDVEYRLIEGDDLVTSNFIDGRINPAYPAERQPRDRTRSASLQQMKQISRNPNPNRLVNSPESDRGAPIVDGNIVESGNGRAAGLVEAYRQGTAKQYRAYLEQHAEEFGLTPEQIAGMRQPILVRQRMTELDQEGIRKFTKDSNESASLGLSPMEQASIDAQSLDGETLSLLSVPDNGNILSPDNQAFVRAFVRNLPEAEQGAFTQKDGKANRDLATRIERAVFAKAFGSDKLLELASETVTVDLKNIINSLANVSGKMAQLRELNSEVGNELSGIFAEATELVFKSRREGKALDELLSQGDMMNGYVSKEVETLARAIDRNLRSGKKMTTLFDGLIGSLIKASSPDGRLFGDDALTPAQAIAYVEQDQNQQEQSQPKPGGDFFGANPERLPKSKEGEGDSVSTDDGERGAGSDTQTRQRQEQVTQAEGTASVGMMGQLPESFKSVQLPDVSNLTFEEFRRDIEAQLGYPADSVKQYLDTDGKRQPLAALYDAEISKLAPEMIAARVKVANPYQFSPFNDDVTDQAKDAMDLALRAGRDDATAWQAFIDAGETISSPQGQTQSKVDALEGSEPTEGMSSSDNKGTPTRRIYYPGNKNEYYDVANADAMPIRAIRAKLKNNTFPNLEIRFVDSPKFGAVFEVFNTAIDVDENAMVFTVLDGEVVEMDARPQISGNPPPWWSPVVSANTHAQRQFLQQVVGHTVPVVNPDTHPEPQEEIIRLKREAGYYTPDGVTFWPTLETRRAKGMPIDEEPAPTPEKPSDSEVAKYEAELAQSLYRHTDSLVTDGRLDSAKVDDAIAKTEDDTQLSDGAYDYWQNADNYLAVIRVRLNDADTQAVLDSINGQPYAKDIAALGPEHTKPAADKGYMFITQRNQSARIVEPNIKKPFFVAHAELMEELWDLPAFDDLKAQGFDAVIAPGINYNHVALIDWKPVRGVPDSDTAPETNPPPKPNANQPSPKIEDFGEILPRARKHLASLTSALNSDIDLMAEPLSKSFPQPDYKKLQEGGMAPELLAVLAHTRAAIPAKPRMPHKVARWVKQVETARDFAKLITDGVLTVDQVSERMRETKAFSAMPDLFALANELTPDQIKTLGEYSILAEEGKLIKGLGDDAKEYTNWFKVQHKDYRKTQVFGELDGALSYIKDQLGKPDSKQPVKFSVGRFRGDKTFSIFRKISAGNYMILGTDFANGLEAKNYLDANYDAVLAKYKNKTQKPPMRRTDNSPRIGEDYRGGENVTPEQFGNTFGFRGVQFGNWVENDKRQQDLNEAYDSLLDLAEILDLPPLALSLNGQLGLAFGARGRGGKNPASAHYEPDLVVINLTKKKGAGSLAHEWFHALDNHFGNRDGGRDPFITRVARPVYKHDVESGKVVKTTPEDFNIRLATYEAFHGIIDAIRSTDMPKRSNTLDKRKSKPYWGTNIEMAARAFETYIINKAAAKGYSNDFLANVISETEAEELKKMLDDYEYPYPLASEMPVISDAFDGLFETLEVEQTDGGFLLNEAMPDYDGKASDLPSGELNENIPNQQEFDFHPAAEVSQQTARRDYTENFNTLYAQREVGQLNIGIEQVTGPQDAAHIFAPLRKRAQENFFILVLDKDRKPIRLIRHSIGRRDGASVDISLVAGAIADTPNAASYYLSHNHPSGNTQHSEADLVVTQKIVRATEGIGIDYDGHVVLGYNGEARFFTDRYNMDVIKATPAIRNKRVAITETRLQKRTLTDQFSVTTSIGARGVADRVKADHALILLNTAHNVIGSISFEADKAKNLKGEERAKRILAATYRANATAVIVKSSDEEVAKNLLGLINSQSDYRVIDWINSDTGWASSENGEQGMWNKEWHSQAKTSSPAPSFSFNLKQRALNKKMRMAQEAIEIITRKLGGSLAGIRIEVIPTQAEYNMMAGRPAHYNKSYVTFGAYNPEIQTAGIIAENIKSVDAAVRTLAHEVIAHGGLRNVIKPEDYKKFIDDILKTRDDPAFAGDWKRIRHDYGRRSEEVQAEELFARFVQYKPENGKRNIWWRRLTNAIRRLLESMGLIPKKDTAFMDDMLNSIVMGFKSNDSSINPDGSDPSSVRYSRTNRDSEQDSVLYSQERTDTRTAKEKLGLGEEASQSLSEKIREILTGTADKLKSDSFWNRVDEGVFDALVGIKNAEEAAGVNDLNKMGYVSARLASGVSDILHGMFNFGVPEWRDGVIQFKEGTTGLLDTLGQLSQEDLNNWLAWMGAKRAERLMEQGRENNLTQDDINELLDIPAEKEALFEAVRKEYNQHNSATLDIAQEAGLISEEQRSGFDEEYYVPFFREEGDTEMDQIADWIAAPFSKKGIASQSAQIRELKGGTRSTKDLLENILRRQSTLLDAALKNNAMREVVTNLKGTDFLSNESLRFKPVIVPKAQIIQRVKQSVEEAEHWAHLMAANGDHEMAMLIEQEAYEQGDSRSGALADAVIEKLDDLPKQGYEQLFALTPPKDKDIVSVRIDGKPQYFRVHDPALLRGLVAVTDTANQAILNRVGRAAKRFLTTGVTLSPDFMLRNFIRDAVHAWMINKDGFEFGKDSMKGLKQAFAEDDDYKALIFSGAAFQGGYIHAADPEAAAQQIRRNLSKRGMGKQEIENYMSSLLTKSGQVIEKYRGWSDKIENANRLSTYKSAREAGKSVREAAFESKDLMDYSRKGNWALIGTMVDFLPFFNARLQGLSKLVRAAKAGEKDKVLKVLSANLAMKGLKVMAFSLALAAINDDDERYQALPNWDKDANWHFFFGDEHWRLPKPFELGIIFGTMPERLFALGSGSQSGKDTANSIQHAFMSTLAINPVPQLVLPFVEVVANKSFFRDAPIEGMGDRNKLPSERYNAYTSDTVKALGGATGLSPKQVEHLIKGYTGTLGSYALMLSDIVARQLLGITKPAQGIERLPLVRTLYQGSGVPSSTMQQSAFYDALNIANEAAGSYKSAMMTGNHERAMEVMEAHREEIGARQALNRIQRQLSVLNKQAELVRRGNYSSEEMRQRLDRINERKNAIYQQAYLKFRIGQW